MKIQPSASGGSRRTPVLIAVVALGLLLIFHAVDHAHALERPNIVFILADDVGCGDFSIHGNPHVKTQTLDQFAREGVQFDRFYVSPVCAPTRASLLTARYWQRGGVWAPSPKCETMRAEEATLAEALRVAGYHTGIFGKWHNGDQFQFRMESAPLSSADQTKPASSHRNEFFNGRRFNWLRS